MSRAWSNERQWVNSLLFHHFRGQWGPPRGVPVPLFPWNKLACSPVPQKSKICFLMLPVPQYCLCSPVPLKIWPLFPWNKCPVCPVPQNPWEGLNSRFLWMATKRLVKLLSTNLIWQEVFSLLLAPPPSTLPNLLSHNEERGGSML